MDNTQIVCEFFNHPFVSLFFVVYGAITVYFAFIVILNFLVELFKELKKWLKATKKSLLLLKS